MDLDNLYKQIREAYESFELPPPGREEALSGLVPYGGQVVFLADGGIPSTPELQPVSEDMRIYDDFDNFVDPQKVTWSVLPDWDLEQSGGCLESGATVVDSEGDLV